MFWKLDASCDDEIGVPVVKVWYGMAAAIATVGNVKASVKNHHLCFVNLLM
jgi:hypothetical protein